MVRGLYTAYTGMANEQRRLDIISNNLANAATTGYKEENVTNQAFSQELAIKIRDRSAAYQDERIGTMSLGVKTGEVYTDYNQGSVRQTGGTFDLAISGEGFFPVSVLNKQGEASIKYTRDGAFKMTSDGFIVDTSGNHLQGLNGDVRVPTDARTISVDSMGFITADNEVVDRIELKDFEDYDYLSKYGDNLYEAVDGATEKSAGGLVLQGYLEQSNVNSVSEMVEMIAITRAYEANQKVIHSIDSMLDKAVNSVGKL